MNDWYTREDRMGKECDGWCYVQIVIIGIAIVIVIGEIIF